jgi:short-subunit dehydrogenase
VAEEFLRQGREVLLCARDAGALRRQAGDLEIKYGPKVRTRVWNLLDHPDHAAAMEECFARPVDGVFMAAGVMFPQSECEGDDEKTLLTFQVNLVSVAVLLNRFAERFALQGSGFISCVSSVAGDRGRQSNFIYGSSKAGLSAYLQGLRNRLAPKGILVQTVKPGFVRTRMTAAMPDSPLMAQPEKAARDIVSAIIKRKDVVYTPFFWKYIMLIIRAIPERVFKRMKL